MKSCQQAEVFNFYPGDMRWVKMWRPPTHTHNKKEVSEELFLPSHVLIVSATSLKDNSHVWTILFFVFVFFFSFLSRCQWFNSREYRWDGSICTSCWLLGFSRTSSLGSGVRFGLRQGRPLSTTQLINMADDSAHVQVKFYTKQHQ